MDGLKNYREKIKNIEKLVDKMENGELSIHELVELETLTRDLHERSIILKYKAFEEVGLQRQETGKEIDPTEDYTEEVTEAVEEVMEEAEEISEMDFSMFDAPAATEDKPKAKHQVNLTQSDDIEEEIVKPEPVVEKKPEPVVEKKPEPVIEKKSEPEVKPEPIVVVEEKGSSFLDRLTILDNSISGQLAGRKIDTLSGAFGINERLQYINQLFDGSGEAFSDAVKVLDTQSNLDAASDKVEEMAFQNSWNPEEEVVLEFLAIIKRRYA